MPRHRFLSDLISSGLSFSFIILSYAPGSNIGNLHFIWKVPENTEPSVCFECSQPSVEFAKKQIPVYHTRAMRAMMFKKFGRIMSSVKPSVLRCFYKELTGKNYASYS